MRSEFCHNWEESRVGTKPKPRNTISIGLQAIDSWRGISCLLFWALDWWRVLHWELVYKNLRKSDHSLRQYLWRSLRMKRFFENQFIFQWKSNNCEIVSKQTAIPVHWFDLSGKNLSELWFVEWCPPNIVLDTVIEHWL